MANVIVFGATGAVGSAAAVEASERGCKVWLAMRDTSKQIKTITPEQEKSGSFERVTADLTDPASVTKAIETSGAKAAFIYAVFPSGDHMQGSIEALKKAGVTWVVLLSSYTIRGPVRDVKPEEIIPHHHAAVEVVLEEAGMPFAAVRGGYFASNEFQKTQQYKQGSVNLAYPEIKHDFIDPKNIGQVAGVFLSEPQSVKPSEPVIVNVLGPDLVSEGDSVKMVGQAIGKDVQLNQVSVDQWVEQTTKVLPVPLAHYMGRILTKYHEHPEVEAEFHRKEGGAVLKYTGKPPTKLADWIEANKQAFMA